MTSKYKIWIDEAWRWPWLWPVVACAFCFNPENKISKEFIKEITDSKKISEKKREIIFEKLVDFSLNNEIYFWVWVVDNFQIDKINIKQANKESMRRALLELLRKIKKENIDSVLIDGNDNYEFEELDKKPIYVIWWDSKIIEIWAASIIAKVFRDKLINTYSSLYPNFWLESHKWYWTKKHSDFLINKSKITWIHRLSYKPIKKILDSKPKLLLHICCWPDASIPIIDLKKDYDIMCFWYDPNIQPKKEYDKRLKNFKKICDIEKVPYIEWEYDVKNFLKSIKWLENTPEKWEKCTKCYDLRLKKTSDLAIKLNILLWTTTLTISPYKDLNKIFSLWEKNSKKNNLEFLKISFRKNKWFERSIEYTKKHKIYRQNYCGCIYSNIWKTNLNEK